jgi:hypothetical protein
LVGAGGCCHPDGDAVDGGGLSKLATVSRFPTSMGLKGSGNGKHTPSCQLRHRLGAQSIIAKIDESNIASTHTPKVDGMWDASLSARVRPSADKSTLRSKQLLDEFEQLYMIHVVDRDRLEKELDKASK